MRALLLPVLLGLTACGALVGIEDVNGNNVGGESGAGGSSGSSGQGGSGAVSGSSGQSGAGQSGEGGAGQGGGGQGGGGQGGAGQGGAGQGGAGNEPGGAGQAGAGQGGAGQAGAGQAGMSGTSGQGGAGGSGCDTVYVAPAANGGDDSAHTGCAPDSPLATITKGIEVAKAKQSVRVGLCRGTHAQSKTLVLGGPIDITGGYDCGDKGAEASVITLSSPGSETATVTIRQTQAGNILLQSLTIDALPGPGTLPRTALAIEPQGATQTQVTVQQSRLRGAGAHHGVEIALGGSAASNISLVSNVILGGSGTLGCPDAQGAASAGVEIRGNGQSSTVSLSNNWISGGSGSFQGTGCAAPATIAGVSVLAGVGSLKLNLGGNVIDAGTLGQDGLIAGVHATFSGTLVAEKNRIYGGSSSGAQASTVGVLVTSSSQMPTARLTNNMIHGGNASGSKVASSEGIAVLAGQGELLHNTVVGGGDNQGGVVRAVRMGAAVSTLTAERNYLLTPSSTQSTLDGFYLEKCPEDGVASASANVFIQGARVVDFPAAQAGCSHGVTLPALTIQAAATILSYPDPCTYGEMKDPGATCTAAEMTLLSSTCVPKSDGAGCAPFNACPGTGCLSSLFSNWSSDGGYTTLIGAVPSKAGTDLSGLGWKLTNNNLPCPILQSMFMGTKLADVPDDIFQAGVRTGSASKKSTPGAEERPPHQGECMNGGGGGGPPT